MEVSVVETTVMLMPRLLSTTFTKQDFSVLCEQWLRNFADNTKAKQDLKALAQ